MFGHQYVNNQIPDESNQMGTIPVKTGILIAHTLDSGYHFTQMNHIKSVIGIKGWVNLVNMLL